MIGSLDAMAWFAAFAALGPTLAHPPTADIGGTPIPPSTCWGWATRTAGAATVPVGHPGPAAG